MSTLTIITDDAERARHQANADKFLADHRNQAVFQAFADAEFDEDITADDVVDAVVLEFGLTRADAVERLAKIDFKAALVPVMP